VVPGSGQLHHGHCWFDDTVVQVGRTVRLNRARVPERFGVGKADVFVLCFER